jgi:flavin reductase (DIM6/NTAB) family NADH-FMN oxidoreductase RutF
MEKPVLHDLNPGSLRIDPMALFDKQWLLLTSGDFAAGRFNTMTVSWGSLGTVWNKPFVQVFCRPQRHTYLFMKTFPTFTLSAFRPACRDALQLLGSKSGKDGNKIAESGLTPVAAKRVAAPTFAEAELVFECSTMHAQFLDSKGFQSPVIEANYPSRDYHCIFFGEILAVRGIASYAAE